MYYRYENMEVLITNRSEKVDFKVNPAFYLPLETILRFSSSGWNKGLNDYNCPSIIRGYIKDDRREIITETYKKWNMKLLEVYYGIAFVIDVYIKRTWIPCSVIKDWIQSNKRTSNSRTLLTVKTQNRIQNKLSVLFLRFRLRIASLLPAYSS